MEKWDGKTEEEIEKEVDAYAEEYKESRKNKVKVAATYDPQAACIRKNIASSYAETFSAALVVSLFNDPSWANFKAAAKQMIKAGAKANVIGLSYELFKAFQACQDAGRLA